MEILNFVLKEVMFNLTWVVNTSYKKRKREGNFINHIQKTKIEKYFFY